MNKRLEGVLADMRESLGIGMGDLTTDEITALVFACARVDNPYSFVNAELVEKPIFVCKGVYLWPITAGAQVWLNEYAAPWWGEGSAMYRWARVFALVNARNPDAFDGLDTKTKARAKILKCALRLVCHQRELSAAVSMAYGEHPHECPKKPNDNDESAATDFAALVARLEVASGIQAKTWLWGKSVVGMMKSYVQLSQLQVAVFGKRNEEADAELDAAVENLARVCAAITERVKNEQGH